MNGRLAIWALPALAVTAALGVYLADANVSLFLLLNRPGPEAHASFWATVTVLGDGAVVFALSLVFARRRPELVWALVLALVFAAVWVRTCKAVIDVKRPLVLQEQVHVIGPGHRERSFPSGHATAAFAFAGVVALGLRRRRIALLAIAAASLAGVSRIVVGVHWPLDVLASVAGGWLCAALAIYCSRRWSWGLRPGPQTVATIIFAAFAVLLVSGYHTGYTDAAAFLRMIGVLALASFAVTYLGKKQEHNMETIEMSPLQASRARAPRAVPAPEPAVSLVIPLYNEEGNVEELVRRTADIMSRSGRSFELICVDDGSRDRTGALLEELAQGQPFLRPVRLMRNYGQSVALQAGFDCARGELIVTMDGDLQNDPQDIPRLLSLIDASPEVDVISGWRHERKDSLGRRLPSMLANRLISVVTGVRLHDYGCGLKVYRRAVIRGMRLYGELHRFAPALAVELGARVLEVPVNHFARTRGKTKYGLGRTFRVVLDLLWIKFLMGFLHRPMHAFGGVGLAMFVCGGGTLVYLAFDKLALHHDIGGRPLLLLGALLVLIGVQIVATGVIGELLIRIYHEPEGRRLYLLRPSRR